VVSFTTSQPCASLPGHPSRTTLKNPRPQLMTQLAVKRDELNENAGVQEIINLKGELTECIATYVFTEVFHIFFNTPVETVKFITTRGNYNFDILLQPVAPNAGAPNGLPNVGTATARLLPCELFNFAMGIFPGGQGRDAGITAANLPVDRLSSAILSSSCRTR